MGGYYDQGGDGGTYQPYSGVFDVGEALGEGGGFGIEQGNLNTAMTAVEVSFTPNPNIAQVLYAHPVVVMGIGDIVKTAAKVAKGIAPVKTGAYRDSINYALITNMSVDRTTGDAHVGPGAPVGLLYSTDYKATWIEFGTGPRPQAGGTRFPAFATLRRAMQTSHTFMKSKGMIGE